MSPKDRKAKFSREYQSDMASQGRKPVTVDNIGSMPNAWDPNLYSEEGYEPKQWEGKEGQTLYMTDDEEAQYTNASKDESPPGAADASTSKDSTPKTTEQSRSSDISKKKWILIGVGVVVVVIIAIVLAVVLSEDKGSTSTDECATETEALQNTAQIQNANAAWNAEFASLTNESAVCNIIDNSGTCTFDSKSLSSHEDYFSACTQVGGSPQTYSDSFSCSFMSNGEKFQIEYQFVDIPECIAFSCDQAAGQASVSELVEHSEIDSTALRKCSLMAVFG